MTKITRVTFEITQFWPVLLRYSIINASITNFNSIEPACHELHTNHQAFTLFNGFLNKTKKITKKYAMAEKL
jgi:hypothetical protein